MSLGREWFKAFREGKFDDKFKEANIIYNVLDDRYYIYKGEHYYSDTGDRKEAIMFFVAATEELKKARES